MRADWVDKNPKAAKALLMAVMEAQQWCDKTENKQEMAEIVGKRQWFNVPVADIIGRAKGDIDYGNGRVENGTTQFMKFWQDHASYPFKSHDIGSSPRTSAGESSKPATDVKALIDKVNREDLWRDAAKTLGVAAADIPASTSRGKETSSTARSSIRKIPPPTSRASPSSALKSDLTGRLFAGGPNYLFNRSIHAMNMPVAKSEISASIPSAPTTPAPRKSYRCR